MAGNMEAALGGASTVVSMYSTVATLLFIIFFIVILLWGINSYTQ